MGNDIFIKQLEKLIKEYQLILNKAQYEDLSGNTTVDEITTLISKIKPAISRIAGIGSDYYKDAVVISQRKDLNIGWILRYMMGPVEALKSDLENDYLKSFRDLVQSEVFSDYLEMADYLLAEGYKDPSAVIIGSTLEAHLRELCKNNSLDIEYINGKGKSVPKKADVLNADLAKAGVYTSAYQKQIIAWFDIRNSAAHGKYEEYEKEEVKLMLQGVRQFVLTTK